MGGWGLFDQLPPHVLNDILDCVRFGRLPAADEEPPTCYYYQDSLFFAALTCRGFRDAIFTLCPFRSEEGFGGPPSHRFYTMPAHVCVSLSRLHFLTPFGIKKPRWFLGLLGCDALDCRSRRPPKVTVLAKYCPCDVFVKMLHMITEQDEYACTLDEYLSKPIACGELIKAAIEGNQFKTIDYLLGRISDFDPYIQLQLPEQLEMARYLYDNSVLPTVFKICVSDVSTRYYDRVTTTVYIQPRYYDRHSTVGDIKDCIEDETGIEIRDMRLHYGNMELLRDDQNVQELNLPFLAELMVTLRARGGGDHPRRRWIQVGA
eukprot:COSAG01_NODE_8092_length_2924_cov_13.688850_3_plen_318_part_00